MLKTKLNMLTNQVFFQKFDKHFVVIHKIRPVLSQFM